MKQLTLLAFLLISSASALTLPDLLTPSDAQLVQACADGHRVESMPRSGQEQTKTYNAAAEDASLGRFLSDWRADAPGPLARLQALTYPLNLQLPTGSVYTACGKAAVSRAAKPDVAALPRFFIMSIAGTAPSREAAQSWNAVLVLLGANGQELVRLNAANTSEGAEENWSPTCTHGTCDWQGKNTYAFDLESNAKAVAQAQKLRVIFTRGKDIEQREYVSTDFEDTFIVL
ncbi:hypothetical protein [Deinococcus alpinitundrae]|uniref:hypothetical protein n=1 Tax=Deinococcus alpinitundrae TaxID=468913 RepID=UPI00137989AD|nr:hypothetical protein [Deinococcus alpinitundrae]